MENQPDQKEKSPNIAGEEAEPDPFTDYQVIDKGNTNHQHYYIEDPIQDPNTNLMSVMCGGCSHGISIEPDKFKVEDGKVVKIA